MFQKIEDLLKTNFKTIIFILEILHQKAAFVRVFKKTYKIKAIIVFPA